MMSILPLHRVYARGHTSKNSWWAWLQRVDARHLSFPWMFSLNSLNSVNSVTKIFVITVKRLEPATPCVRNQDATTVPSRHMWETGSLNWAQFMLQWFIRFPEFSEFLYHLRKTPLYFNFSYSTLYWDLQWYLQPRNDAHKTLWAPHRCPRPVHKYKHSM